MSPIITPGGSGGSQPVIFASLPVSSAEILSLPSSGIELLPAPGGRFYYVLHKAFLHYRFGTTPYTGASAGDLFVAYGDAATSYYSLQLAGGDGPTLTPADLLSQSADTYGEFFLTSDSSSAWLASQIEDVPISLGMFAGRGSFVDGDGTITIRLWYSLINGAPS